MWYIEDKSNNTLAPFSKRSASDFINHKQPISKRATFPQAYLTALQEAFQEYFHLNISDIAYAHYPNPFAGLSSATSSIRSSSSLTLVDGSESGQAIPLWGLIQPDRSSSFIIAWDSNEDAAPNNWNNGTNLYDTYLAANKSGIPFPIVPPATTMVNRNYSISPVFFGCDPKLTTTGDTRSPIVLYMASAPYSAYTNFSYAQTAFMRSQMNDIFVNSFNQITQGNGTLDAQWPVCLGCATIDRSLGKMGMNRTEQCEQCFSKYCWDGVYDNEKAPIVDPSLILYPNVTFAEWNKTHSF